MKAQLLLKAGGPMTIDDPNPFDGCDLDEVFALIFDLEGPKGLQSLLAKAKLDREALTAAATKLDQAGLRDAAAIIRQASTKAPTQASREIADVMADHDVIQQRAYLAALYRRGQIIRADLEASIQISSPMSRNPAEPANDRP
jgi:hypothetical protein